MLDMIWKSIDIAIKVVLNDKTLLSYNSEELIDEYNRNKVLGIFFFCVFVIFALAYTFFKVDPTMRLCLLYLCCFFILLYFLIEYINRLLKEKIENIIMAKLDRNEKLTEKEIFFMKSRIYSKIEYFEKQYVKDEIIKLLDWNTKKKILYKKGYDVDKLTDSEIEKILRNLSEIELKRYISEKELEEIEIKKEREIKKLKELDNKINKK